MRLAFELSMEHPTLPRADALAALESEGVHIRGVSFSPEILVVDSVRPPRRAFERVALSRYVDRVLAMGRWPTIFRAAARVDLGGKSFRIRAHGPFSPEAKRDLELRLGAAMPATGRVDLADPERDFRLLRHGDAFLLGEVLCEVERSAIEARKDSHWPVTIPLSLPPQHARA